ncbi:MAG: hypothetical protein M1829_006828, partial [Trizodia sp. TS-e1964]
SDMATEEETPSYIDYEALLDPSFSSTSFANTLIRATNNPSDLTLDLSTPLSRVLFDIQEIDTHIHNLTTKSAVPLLSYIEKNVNLGLKIVQEVESQVEAVNKGYKRLEKEVVQRVEVASQVHLTAERLWHTLNLGRSVVRCLTLARQLETQLAEFSSSTPSKREDHRALVRAAHTVLSFRQLFGAWGTGEEGEGLGRVAVVSTLKNDLLRPAEMAVRAKAQQTVREFSVAPSASSTATPSTRPEDARAAVSSAFTALYLLSPTLGVTSTQDFKPALLLEALQSYLQASITSSTASLARALSVLPTLDRACAEVSTRCQNLLVLESLLGSIAAPEHLLLAPGPAQTLLEPVLHALDAASLPSHFWRSLASALTARVQEVVARGGAPARALRTQRERVRECIRDCVLKGSHLEANGKVSGSSGWEREVAVMVGVVTGNLGR